MRRPAEKKEAGVTAARRLHDTAEGIGLRSLTRMGVSFGRAVSTKAPSTDGQTFDRSRVRRGQPSMPARQRS
jgi:hypothetical protein